MAIFQPKFDWYQATIRHDVNDVLDCLMDELNCSSFRQERGFNFYENCYVLMNKTGNDVAKVLAGGRNEYPNVIGSSDNSILVSDAIRSSFPEHYVTRVDSAADYDNGAGTWNKMSKMVLQFADEKNLSVRQDGDHHRGIYGRTWYIGSKTSNARLRLYEKGKEIREKYSISASENWVRCELQVRPKDSQRLKAATASPAQIWGFSSWSHDFANENLSKARLSRFKGNVSSPSTRDQALGWMVKQYGKVLKAEADDLGGWDVLGLTLREMYKNINKL